MRKTINRWLPVFLWLCLIFYFSSRPDLPGPKEDVLNFIVKKSAHITEFFILFVLVSRAISQKLPSYAFLFCLLVAFSDEIHQMFTPGRGAKLSDVAIDSFGISLGVLFITKINGRIHHQ